tara:strand:- start:428 stop:565 length:138 start_codon:yes stop_codon:yes gene_type:complete
MEIQVEQLLQLQQQVIQLQLVEVGAEELVEEVVVNQKGLTQFFHQ